MKHIETYLGLAAVCLLVFASCSDIPEDHGDGVSDIHIRLVQPETRAVTDPFDQVNQVYTTFSYGGIFFVDDSGNILHPIIVNNRDVSAVRPSDLKTGHTFPSISDRAKRVVVVANKDFTRYPDGSTELPSFSTIDKLRADFAITIIEQVTDENDNVDRERLGVENAVMWGEGPISDAVSQPWQKEVSVDLTPIISRFEIGKLRAIRYEDDTRNGIDDGFELEGIFMNNIYLTAGTDGKAIDLKADLFNMGKNWNVYYEASRHGYILYGGDSFRIDGEYPDELEDVIFNIWWKHEYEAVDHIIQPDNGQAWAFNAFATSRAIPHIVLRFWEVRDGGWRFTNSTTKIHGMAYLTINNYVNVDDNSIIYEMENGKVYYIEELVFGRTDLANTPEPGGGYTARVRVQAIPWVEKEIETGIGRD